ncbi:hypothetical protein F183_A38870 [Bryobacterales bacterium F-183]|nr:hypothetical protein F183_A38870 [Bryobacterales bacterium F-183]
MERIDRVNNDLEYLEICHQYVNSLKDGHVSFRFPSNFVTQAPIRVDIYDGKPTIENLSAAMIALGLRAGDEILTFNGEPADKVIESLYPYTGYGSNPRGERRWASDYLFFRPQSVFPRAPQLPDTSTVTVRHADGTEATVEVPWTKTGEPFVTYGTVPEFFTGLGRSTASVDAVNGTMTSPLPEDAQEWEKGMMALGHSARPATEYDRGVRNYGAFAPAYSLPTGFVLRRGTLASDPFVTGWYPAGTKRIGYIRLPNMSPASFAGALQILEQEIQFLQENTDGLVVDVMRNTGGIIIYGHEVARRLIPTPFRGIGFELRATATRLASLSAERASLANSGAPQWALDHYDALIADIREAIKGTRQRTGPLPLNMPSLDVQPAAVVYTKPLIVLIDEFSVSTADLFPALIQDAGRGTLVGWRTGGLGGTNGAYSAGALTESQVGVTFGLMVRPKAIASEYGTTNYIENVGVRPDIELDIMTNENRATGGRPFVNAFTDIILDKIGR